MTDIPDVDEARDELLRVERAIAARKSRIHALNQEIDAGRKFISAWPDRERHLLWELDNNHNKIEALARKRAKATIGLSKAEKMRTLLRLKEQVKRLEREVEEEKRTGKPTPPPIHIDPTRGLPTQLDYFGERHV